MERESNPMQALCRSGCGFYGSPATDGLCSLCYKEALKKKQQPPVTSPSPASAVTNTSLSSLMETATAQPTVPCLSATSNSTDLPATDSMSEGQSPSDQKECNDNGKFNSDNTSGSSRGQISSVGTTQNPQKTDGSDTTSRTVLNDLNENEGTSAGTFEAVEEGATGSSLNVEAAKSGEQQDSPNDKDSDKDAKKKKNRCATCRKKVGLTGFECRCGGLFCAVHRYSDKHDCSFNYREMGAQEIRRNNPVVVGEKIQKI